MISVEVKLSKDKPAPESVEIYLDSKGLTDLQGRLSLLGHGDTDHIHLMTESWGLGDLSDEKHTNQNELIHHLKIILVD